MKKIDLSVHENPNKLINEVVEAISQIPTNSDSNIFLNQDSLIELCVGFYKRGFDFGVFETVKTINNDSRVNKDIIFSLDLPI